jgi:hypothetical protein
MATEKAMKNSILNLWGQGKSLAEIETVLQIAIHPSPTVTFTLHGIRRMLETSEYTWKYQPLTIMTRGA